MDQPPSSPWREFSGASEKSNLTHLVALIILELTFLAAAVALQPSQWGFKFRITSKQA